MRHLSLYLLFLVVCRQQVCQAQVERNLSVELIEERVNGKLFSYRLDIETGSKVKNSQKEHYMIEGEITTRQEYDQKIDFERLQEIKAQREKEYSQRFAQHEFKRGQRIALTKKILKNVIGEIEKKCTDFERYDLNQYMAYSPVTIENEIDFTNIATHYLEPARQFLFCSEEKFAFDQVESVLISLQHYPSKIGNLFEDTVKKAIEQCDDTERLKKLLEIVS